MNRFDDEPDVQALRDECLLAGTPMDGDEDVAALFDTLRETRLAAKPVPSAALTALLDHGFEPAGSTTRRLRLAVARRFAATGLALKLLIGTVAVGAGVATAGVVGSIPGEAIVSDAVDAVTPGGTDEDARSPGAPVDGDTSGPTSEPSAPGSAAVAPDAAPAAAGEPAAVDGPPGSVGGGNTPGEIPPGQADKPDKTPPGQNGNGNGNPGGNGNGNGNGNGGGNGNGNAGGNAGGNGNGNAGGNGNGNGNAGGNGNGKAVGNPNR